MTIIQFIKKNDIMTYVGNCMELGKIMLYEVI